MNKSDVRKLEVCGTPYQQYFRTLDLAWNTMIPLSMYNIASKLKPKKSWILSFVDVVLIIIIPSITLLVLYDTIFGKLMKILLNGVYFFGIGVFETFI